MPLTPGEGTTLPVVTVELRGLYEMLLTPPSNTLLTSPPTKLLHVLHCRLKLCKCIQYIDVTFPLLLCDTGHLSLSSSMSVIYQQHKDEDGFVYMAYSGENSMG